MRVLLHNRAHDLWQGGDATTVVELETRLRALGVDASYTSDPGDLRAYDVVHLHNVSMPWTWDVFCRARAAAARIIVSTIYEPGVFHLVSAERQRGIVAAADAVICYSDSEARTVVRDLLAHPSRIHTCRLGVSADFATGIPPLPHEYVLEVGRIEPRKNQLALITALRDTPVVLAGDVFDVGYYDHVLRASAGNVRHVSIASRETLRGLYRGARVFCLPSRFELCGLVNLEAAVAGCHLVTSDVGGIREYCGDLATYVDPDDTAALAAAVDRLWHTPRPQPDPALADRYSWVRCAAEHLAVYERSVRAARPTGRP